MADELPDPQLRLFTSKASENEEPELERCVDSQLWQACAGCMVEMPPTGSLAYYFAQGHVEHARCSHQNLPTPTNNPTSPPVFCRVDSLKFFADPQTDEVFAKIRLCPIKRKHRSDPLVREEMREDDTPVEAVPVTFVKTLTQSDTDTGTSFTVSIQFAETMIFPHLNYKEEGNHIYCRDVHGAMWKFTYTYSDSSQRHLLSEGWAMFVRHKQLLPGDSVVFMKKNSGEMHVGIRRKNVWNDSNMLSRISSKRIRMESVVEATRQALGDETFEVVYFPRAGTPEYCVKASLLRKASTMKWLPGMKIRMAVESDDQSSISWVYGTVTGVGGQHQWRRLDVSWECGELKNGLEGKGVNPWMVEPVSGTSMPSPQLGEASFTPPPKRPRLQLLPLAPSSSSTLLPGLSTGSQFQMPQQQQQQKEGIQGFRHDEVGKDDTACVLTLGVGHSAATASEQICDVGTSGDDNDAAHDNASSED